jgi:hypothetical protein
LAPQLPVAPGNATLLDLGLGSPLMGTEIPDSPRVERSQKNGRITNYYDLAQSCDSVAPKN